MKYLLNRNLAAIIDFFLATVFSLISYLALAILFYDVVSYVEFMSYIIYHVEFIFFIIYLSIPFLLNGKSIGKQLFHIKVAFISTRRQYLRLFFREVIIKLGLFLVAPYIILIQLFEVNKYLAILYAVIISASINNIVYLFLKKYLWDYFTGTSVQKEEREAINPQKPKMLLKWFANCIDMSIILIISMFIYLLLQRWVLIDFYWIVLFFSLCYFVIAYSACKTTTGKYVFGIELVFNTSRSVIYNVFIREVVFKFLPVIVLLVLFKITRLENIYYNLIIIGMLYMYVLLWFQSIKHCPYWDLYAKTHKNIKKSNPRRIVIWEIALLLFYVLSFMGIKQLNNTYPTSGVQFLGVELYEYNKHHPVDKNVQAKVDYIKAHPVSAKEYVLQLFNKYDIVVLGERFHAEMTQWDLFYDIVSDPRFIQNAGHIFTEVGSAVDYQYLSDEYFTTIYPDDSSLDKATAHLMQHDGVWEMWNNTNIFNFFKKVNLLNATLPDSLKLKEYFTGCNKFGKEVKTHEDYKRKSFEHRDSLMADVVIRKFNEIRQTNARKKCLVITNYRHSFNYTKFSSGPSFHDETSYIFHAFPEITANVLVHTTALGLPSFAYPLNKSTWDKAFEICGNPSRGFDFKDSPFGLDYFDLLFMDFGQKDSISYQDIYTGYVFYIPLSEFVFQYGIPYAMDNFRDEFKRRYYLRSGEYKDSTDIEHIIKSRYERGYQIEYASDNKAYFLSLNYEIVLSVVLLITGFVIVLLSLMILLGIRIRNR